MQRDENVATGLQVPGLLTGKKIVDEDNLRQVADAVLQGRSGLGMMVAIDGLDHQRDVVAACGRLAKGGQCGLGIFAVLIGMKVVHHQGQQFVLRQAKLATRRALAWRKGDGVGNFDHGHRGKRGNGILHKSGGYPHFVHMGKGSQCGGGKLGLLPVPVADAVAGRQHALR